MAKSKEIKITTKERTAADRLCLDRIDQAKYAQVSFHRTLLHLHKPLKKESIINI